MILKALRSQSKEIPSHDVDSNKMGSFYSQELSKKK